ncbi:MAG: carboxymuconolactone decarboxylase family protein [Nocardioides sp.]|mgnify:CR=1|nr:carboxymuconolactone decarboxylase family protein [Nocardioides sp.]
MTERLPRLTPDALDDAQQVVYDGIAGGDRAKGVQHFPLTAGDGSLNGPFGIMLHAPQLGNALQQLGSAIRYGTSLTPRVREIAILMVARATGSAFEAWAHEPIGLAVGLTEAELEAVARGDFTSTDPVEQASVDLVACVLDGAALDDATYATLASRLGVPPMIEVIALVGYYRTLADLMQVFDVGVPSDA